MTEDGALQKLNHSATVHLSGPSGNGRLGGDGAMRLLQGKYVLSLVRALLAGPQGFTALLSASGARSPTTLQARLVELQGAGVVVHLQRAFALTATGLRLAPVFGALDRFTVRFPELPPEEILGALQRRHAMPVMRALMGGELGFNGLQRAVTAPSATTLARRLGDLEALRLIVRRVHSAMPPRTGYAHSEIGSAFSEVVGQIVAWGEGLTLSELEQRLAASADCPQATSPEPPQAD